MQARLNHIRRFIPFLAFVLGAAAALPQSLNREAMKWFDTGLAEKSAAKRIAAYAKAVEIDPNFAEALFNLGAAYREQKDYDRAEQYFRRAANSAKTDLRVKALSEMASIYNIRGNSKSYESALREAKTLAADSKQRALLSYELGRFLYQQGRYEQAVSELKEGRAGDPGQRESFDNLLKLAENSSQLDYLYATAEKQKAGGNLKEAKATLEQIKAKNASFRNVQARLAEVETLLAAESGKTASAAAANNVNTNVNTNDAEAEAAYAAGLAAIRKRDWVSAIAAFERVLQINPDYRDARQKLAGAQMYFERDNVEAIAARYYDEGVAAMNHNDLDSALVLLGKVQKINRRYRDVANLYAQVEAARRLNPASTLPATESAMEAPDASVAANLSATPPFADSTRAASPFAANTELDSLYQIASAAFGRGDWNEAVLGFQKIRMKQINYRDVDQLFATSRARLLETSGTAEAAAAINRRRPSLLMIAGLAVAAVGFFVCGFIFLSPAARARYQSRRGNHETAVLIYESLLARHPSRLKLYPALAEIYLKLVRRDEAAMKVYRRVLDLNLPSRHRADLSEIVALNTVEEKPVHLEVVSGPELLTAEPLMPEPVAAVNGVLLADGGFQAPEKIPARRPRKKKENVTPLNGAASVPVAEEAAAEIPASAEPQVKAPAKPRQPRRKKEASREAGVENGAAADHRAESAPPEPAPAKKTRRKKITVVEAMSTNGTEGSVAALETNLRVDGVELVVPAESEPPQHETVTAL